MKKGRGRPKGNAFENKIAKTLVKAFGLKKKDCYRTPGSGGHRQASKTDPGDLVISKRMRKVFPFSVECKHYKAVPLYWFFKPEKKRPKQLKSWLSQAETSAKKQKKMYPLLIFRANNAPIFCALPGVYPLVTRCRPKLRFTRGDTDWFLLEFDVLVRALVKEGAQYADK